MVRIIKILMLASILVSGLAMAGCSSSSAPPPVLQAGSPAPDFQLQGLDGQAVSLSSLRGRPVMLSFWAIRCPSCRAELPFKQMVFEDMEWKEQGLVILAINVGESPSIVKRFVEDNSLSFNVLLDTEGSVAWYYNVRGIPTTYFIDKNGIIRDRRIGPFLSKAEIDWRLINSILDGE